MPGLALTNFTPTIYPLGTLHGEKGRKPGVGSIFRQNVALKFESPLPRSVGAFPRIPQMLDFACIIIYTLNARYYKCVGRTLEWALHDCSDICAV